MNDTEHNELKREVARIFEAGADYRDVSADIRSAHFGRPCGWVTTTNLHLFRRYRNTVSPSPAQLLEDCGFIDGSLS